MHGIRAFEYDHARITAELPGKRAVAGVNRIDLRCAALQQTVNESADVAAEVGTNEPGYVYSKMLEGGCQLVTAARDVGIFGRLGF